MIDLSNNNWKGHNFAIAYNKGGQRRLYVKISEGRGYVDDTARTLRVAAIRAGIRVGGYHFANSWDEDPRAQARFFLEHLPGLDYRYHCVPCLDLEEGTPSADKGAWAYQWLQEVKKETGRQPIIYGSPYYLGVCFSGFKKLPAPLWLASYGRNTGVEYPFVAPLPWKLPIAAHQFTSNGVVPGIFGKVDVSHVFDPGALDVHRFSVLRHL